MHSLIVVRFVRRFLLQFNVCCVCLHSPKMLCRGKGLSSGRGGGNDGWMIQGVNQGSAVRTHKVEQL